MPAWTGQTVYRLIHRFKGFEQTMENVYFYGGATNAEVATDLANAWIDQIFPVWRNIIVGNCQSQSIFVEGLVGAADLYNVDLVENGLRTGQQMPPFVAWAFRLNRGARGERNGYKRFGLISETDVEEGSAALGVIDELDSMASILSAEIGQPVPFWSPLIQRRFENKVELDPPTYWTFNDASYVNVSTQNSRKIGRGM